MRVHAIRGWTQRERQNGVVGGCPKTVPYTESWGMDQSDPMSGMPALVKRLAMRN